MEVEAPNRKIIAIGGSAGSSSAFPQILAAIPADLRAAIFVVLHRTLIDGVDYVPSALNRCGTLRASLARDGEIFEDGRIYVAPAKRHLLIEANTVRLEHMQAAQPRKDIDRFFESAALSHGSQVIGVL